MRAAGCSIMSVCISGSSWHPAEAKLLHFCDDILEGPEGSKNDPIALNIYENCRKSVRGGGVSLSALVAQ